MPIANRRRPRYFSRRVCAVERRRLRAHVLRVCRVAAMQPRARDRLRPGQSGARTDAMNESCPVHADAVWMRAATIPSMSPIRPLPDRVRAIPILSSQTPRNGNRYEAWRRGSVLGLRTGGFACADQRRAILAQIQTGAGLRIWRVRHRWHAHVVSQPGVGPIMTPVIYVRRNATYEPLIEAKTRED